MLSTYLLKTLILSGKITNVVTVVGVDIVMTTFSKTISSIKYAIAYIKSTDNDVNDLLIQTDLCFTVSIIEDLVKEQKTGALHMSVKEALIGVNEILERIRECLDSVKSELNNYERGYFRSWSKFKWSGDINRLELYDKLLKHRYGILFELLKIYKEPIGLLNYGDK